MKRAGVSLVVLGAAWLFCVIASASGWHAAGLAAAVLVVPLFACAFWLNRSAGGEDGEEDDEEES